MKRLLLSFAIICVCSTWLKAEHIIGGELTYRDLGSDLYEVQLIIYRDCNGLTNFDNPAYLDVYTALDNVLTLEFTLSDPIVTSIEDGAFECAGPFVSTCTEKGVYLDTISLPDIVGGYNIVYNRCCLSAAFVNLTEPDEDGFAVFAHIPGTDITTINSSPVFSPIETFLVCLDEPISTIFTATDPDGDALVYTFYEPFLGGNPANPAPVPALPPPYATVNYEAGFSGIHPLNASPELAINPATGEITGTPLNEGFYLIGIAVSEFRDGILLNTTYLQTEFIVANCTPVFPTISVDTEINSCNTFEIDFNNATDFWATSFWDFGDGDTSNLYSPSHTYTTAGTYNATYIANKGLFCSDTANITIHVLPISPTTIDFDYSPDLDVCFSDTLLFYTDADPDYNWINTLTGAIIGENDTLDLSGDIGAHSITLFTTDDDFCYLSDTVEATVHAPLGMALIPSVWFDGQVILICLALESPDVDTYQWYLNGNPIAGEADSEIIFIDTCGYYSITITDIYGCVYTSEAEFLCPTAIENYATTLFEIMPNPSDGIITINSDKINGLADIKLFNVLGETVLMQQINFDKSQTLHIETGPGLYFLEISNNNQRCIQQLIIK